MSNRLHGYKHGGLSAAHSDLRNKCLKQERYVDQEIAVRVFRMSMFVVDIRLRAQRAIERIHEMVAAALLPIHRQCKKHSHDIKRYLRDS